MMQCGCQWPQWPRVHFVFTRGSNLVWSDRHQHAWVGHRRFVCNYSTYKWRLQWYMYMNACHICTYACHICMSIMEC